MQKTALGKASAIGVILLVFLISGGMFVPSTMAAVQVGDNLYLFADFRFRYEIDEERDEPVARDRDRARIRARFGFKYDWSNNVSFGLRLRTASNNNQSPHQTLGLLAAGDNADFGLDRAYIEMKFLENGFFWLGKHAISWWEQNEAFWDLDIQPEGAGGGYIFKLGPNGVLTLQGTHSILTDNGFGSSAGNSTSKNGIFEDDTATGIQGVYNRAMGPHAFTVASGALIVSDRSVKSTPGGSTTYTITSVEYKNKSLLPKIPLKVGFDYLNSTFNSAAAGTTQDAIGVGDKNEGYVVNFSAKYGNWGFKFEHYRIELNAVPAQGTLAQDDFRFSSNFEGQKYQLSYKFGKGYNVDFRVYPQERIDDTIVSGAANVGSYVQTEHQTTRYQVNLNIKF